ncbi:type II toxin-antitoxin system RelE/ParE family toxin [Treponema sp. OMZ 840]|uniref:type II toxin-antitoxin system RelE/ParE family toxin n=1 Tax=Treponema sp. OMZ 840 TaxID=244313 RepID=UPI003D902570
MIYSWGNKDTEKIWNGFFVRSLPHDIQCIAKRKLVHIHAAKNIDDLRVPPGNRLEKLGGDKAGIWSIRINEQWRICFRWEAGNAFDVIIIDYH